MAGHRACGQQGLPRLLPCRGDARPGGDARLIAEDAGAGVGEEEGRDGHLIAQDSINEDIGLRTRGLAGIQNGPHSS